MKSHESALLANAADFAHESLHNKSKLPVYSCRLWSTEHVFPMHYAFAANGMSLLRW
jgi:hypothetical protein